MVCAILNLLSHFLATHLRHTHQFGSQFDPRRSSPTLGQNIQFSLIVPYSYLSKDYKQYIIPDPICQLQKGRNEICILLNIQRRRTNTNNSIICIKYDIIDSNNLIVNILNCRSNRNNFVQNLLCSRCN